MSFIEWIANKIGAGVHADTTQSPTTMDLNFDDNFMTQNGVSRGKKEPRTVAYRPMPGWTQNPLKGFPRNNPCFCGSKTKAKRCCIPKLDMVMNTQDAMRVRANWENIVSGKMQLEQRSTESAEKNGQRQS